MCFFLVFIANRSTRCMALSLFDTLNLIDFDSPKKNSNFISDVCDSLFLQIKCINSYRIQPKPTKWSLIMYLLYSPMYSIVDREYGVEWRTDVKIKIHNLMWMNGRQAVRSSCVVGAFRVFAGWRSISSSSPNISINNNNDQILQICVFRIRTQHTNEHDTSIHTWQWRWFVFE